MPSATLRFSLPEDADEFRCAQRAADYLGCLFDIVQVLRDRRKYETTCATGDQELAELESKVWAILNEVGVDPYNE